MHIGIDGRALQDQPRGGVGHYTHELLRALFTLDHENEYVVWYNGLGKIVAPDFREYPNVRIYKTRWPNKILNVSMWLFKWQFFSPLRLRGSKTGRASAGPGGEEGLRTSHNAPQPPLNLRGGDRVDIFFLPNPNFIALPPGVKLVAVAHDLSFEHFPDLLPLKSRLWHRAVNPRALFNRADHIIAVSEHTKNDLIATYEIPATEVAVVHPGLTPITRYTPPATSYTPYMLYLGALEPRKNIAGLIQAYELLEPRETLMIAGLATPYVRHLKKRIAKSPFRTKITLIENPTEETKNALYAGASLFVYPSFYEGFGFPPLEAMAAGVPVVASSASSVREVCEDAALLVNPWNSAEIAQGIKIMLANETLRTRYIAAGKNRVRQFRWDTCARKVLNILHTLCT